MGTQRRLLHVGVLPRLSAWQARERLPAEKKEEQMSGQTRPRVNKTGTRAQDAETKWLARLPEVPGVPPLPVHVPRAHKSYSCVPGSHPQLRPLGLWQRRLRRAERCDPSRHSAFRKGASSDVEGARPSVGPACHFTVPLRKDEAQRGKRPPEDTGPCRGPMATHGSITATFPGDSDPVP